MTLHIVPCNPDLAANAVGLKIDLPVVSFVGIDGDEIVGSGGLAWGAGRCWIWFTVIRPEIRYAVAIVRMAKRLLVKARQLGERMVFTIRDPQFETSPRLMMLSGFQFYGIEDGKEIYVHSFESVPS